jgi:AcrR family transcriptional regulator
MVVEGSGAVTPAATGRPRGRRDELIMDALERLLATSPLRDLGVEEIAEESGITRTRFYHYYKSKYEAYAALLRRTSVSSFGQVSAPGSWFERSEDTRPRDALLATLQRALGVWLTHREVLREASDLWNAMPEVRDIQYGVVSHLSEVTATSIERERARGVAPPGADARRLAYSLLWQGERLQFLTAIEAPDAMSVDDLIDVVLEIWMRTIYCSDDPDPSPRST